MYYAWRYKARYISMVLWTTLLFHDDKQLSNLGLTQRQHINVSMKVRLPEEVLRAFAVYLP
jgi:hypothetical protein